MQRIVDGVKLGPITPQHFDAVGDGVADDSAAIKAALDHCCAAGVPFRGLPGSTYRIGTAVTVARTPDMPPLDIDWCGSKLFLDGVGITIGSNPAAYLTTALSIDVARGATKLTIDSANGVTTGDMLVIESPAIWIGSTPVRHCYIVSEVDGNTVWIEGAAVADIAAAQVTNSGATGPLVVKAYKLAKPLSMRNGVVEISDPDGELTALKIAGHSRVLTDSMVYSGHTRNQLYAIYCGYVTTRASSFKDMGYVTKDTGYVSLPEHPSGLGFGYGVITAFVYHHRVEGCHAGRGWHGVDAAVGTMHCVVDGCSFERNAFGVDAHESAWHLVVRNCDFVGGSGVGGSRCAYLHVEGNTFRDLSGHGVVYDSKHIDVQIENNTFDTGWQAGSVLSAVYRYSAGGDVAGYASADRDRRFLLKGNTVVGHARVHHAGFGAPGMDVVEANTLIGGAAFYP